MFKPDLAWCYLSHLDPKTPRVKKDQRRGGNAPEKLSTCGPVPCQGTETEEENTVSWKDRKGGGDGKRREGEKSLGVQIAALRLVAGRQLFTEQMKCGRNPLAFLMVELLVTSNV